MGGAMGPLVIRSGGQTGVDRAALDLAVRIEIPYCGWCPRGGWAEDLPEPPGLLARYPLLTETPSPEPEQRTAWNVRDGDATLILSRAGAHSTGTAFTRLAAELIFLRPCLVVDLQDGDAAARARDWLSRPDRGPVLNVAGPRESEAPGIYADALAFLAALLG
jgi:hypothetical protein